MLLLLSLYILCIVVGFFSYVYFKVSSARPFDGYRFKWNGMPEWAKTNAKKWSENIFTNLNSTFHSHEFLYIFWHRSNFYCFGFWNFILRSVGFFFLSHSIAVHSVASFALKLSSVFVHIYFFFFTLKI